MISAVKFIMDNSRSLYWIDETISLWKSDNVRIQVGISADQISFYEKQLDFGFPSDFIDLYLRVNGFEDFEWEKNMFSLWSLDRILTEYHERNDPDFIGFCDFLVNSHCIGFWKEQKGIFKSYDRARPIAASFAETIGLINANSELIY